MPPSHDQIPEQFVKAFFGIYAPKRTLPLTPYKPPETPASIYVVIPVKNNQDGIDRLLESFFIRVPAPHRPRNIIIVDNNSIPALQITPAQIEIAKAHNVEIKVLLCTTPGASAARNTGWRFAVANRAEWILFIDSDCIFTDTSIGCLIDKMDGSIAYQSRILSAGSNWLGELYDQYKSYKPAMDEDPYDHQQRPVYLTSCCLLVNADGLIKTGGFNEDYSGASFEDITLTRKLSDYGTLQYVQESVVLHDYLDGGSRVTAQNVLSLIKRFERYGFGYRTYKVKEGTAFEPSTLSAFVKFDFIKAYKDLLATPPDTPIKPFDLPTFCGFAYGALRFGYMGESLDTSATPSAQTMSLRLV